MPQIAGETATARVEMITSLNSFRKSLKFKNSKPCAGCEWKLLYLGTGGSKTRLKSLKPDYTGCPAPTVLLSAISCELYQSLSREHRTCLALSATAFLSDHRKRFKNRFRDDVQVYEYPCKFDTCIK